MSNNDSWSDIEDDEIRIIRSKSGQPSAKGSADQRGSDVSDDSDIIWNCIDGGEESPMPKCLMVPTQLERDLSISDNKKPVDRKKVWIYALSALFVIVITAVIFFSLADETAEEGVVKTVTPAGSVAAESAGKADAITSKGYVDVVDTVVGDVPLTVLYPHDAVPTLQIGENEVLNDRNVALAAQAADVRGDNGGIVGAYVLHGELKARGKSKSGFCAIVNGDMTIGVADATPLLEKAIEDDGYFFRQYPLVVGGQIVENKPKGRSLRKALAEIDGSFAVVMSGEPLTFHEFSQSLVDLGVSNAIYLIGATSVAVYKTADGTRTVSGVPNDPYWKNVNYIVWR